MARRLGDGLGRVVGNRTMLYRYEEAEAVLRRALAAREDPSVRARLGAALAAIGRPEEGIGELRAVLADHPGHPEALINLLAVLTETDRFPEAEALVPQVLEAAGDDARAHLAVAELAVRGDRIEEARRHLRRALEIDPRLRAARALFSRLPD